MQASSLMSIAAMALLSAMQPGVAAQPELAERIGRCADEKNDARRLACYDSEAARLPPPARASAAPASEPAQARDAAQGELVHERKLETATGETLQAPPAGGAFGVAGSELARQRTLEAAAGETAQAASTQEFGVQGSELARERKRTSESAEGVVKRLAAKVTSLTLRPRGELVVTLDNGQVWAQKKAESYFPLKTGDPVTILAGALGSYRLVAGGRATPVTRIQ